MILDDYGMAEALAKKVWDGLGLDKVAELIDANELAKLSEISRCNSRMRGNLVSLAEGLPPDKKRKYCNLMYAVSRVVEPPMDDCFADYCYDSLYRDGMPYAIGTVFISYNFPLPEKLQKIGHWDETEKLFLFGQLDFRMLLSSCRHEVTHAIRHAEIGKAWVRPRSSSRSVSGMCDEAWCANERERDAVIHEVAETRRFTGEHWDKMSLDELFDSSYNMDKLLKPPHRKTILKRLLREGLVGKRMMEELTRIPVTPVAS